MIQTLNIPYISCHLLWHPAMPQEKMKLQTNGFRGHIKLPRPPWKTVALQHTATTPARLSGNAPFSPPPVCVECVAPVVAINPNLTDTGSKSTFREPWKLTGEDSLPSPRLTSKTRQQWRLQWKTSTFRKNKETRREESRTRLETRDGREAEYQKGMNSKKGSICPMQIL